VKSGFERCGDLFSGPHPSAIFAANDDMVIGATMAVLKAGLDMLGDISIAGFDGSRLGEIFWPKLTTIFQPTEKMSKTENFVALKVEIANWRWAGVPFYLRTGKRMDRPVCLITKMT